MATKRKRKDDYGPAASNRGVRQKKGKKDVVQRGARNVREESVLSGDDGRNRVIGEIGEKVLRDNSRREHTVQVGEG